MSGGHWDYEEGRLRDVLERVADDVLIRERFPMLAKRLSLLGNRLYEVIHALDYDLSGDAGIKDDHAFELEAIRKLYVLGPPWPEGTRPQEAYLRDAE